MKTLKFNLLLMSAITALVSCGGIDGKPQNFLTINNESKFRGCVYLSFVETATYQKNLTDYIKGLGDDWGKYSSCQKEGYSNDVKYASSKERFDIYYDVAKTGSFVINVDFTKSDDKLSKYIADNGTLKTGYDMDVVWIPDFGGVVEMTQNSSDFKYSYDYDYTTTDEKTKEKKTEHITEVAVRFDLNKYQTNSNFFNKAGSVIFFNLNHKKENISNLKITFSGTLSGTCKI